MKCLMGSGSSRIESLLLDGQLDAAAAARLMAKLTRRCDPHRAAKLYEELRQRGRPVSFHGDVVKEYFRALAAMDSLERVVPSDVWIQSAQGPRVEFPVGGICAGPQVILIKRERSRWIEAILIITGCILLGGCVRWHNCCSVASKSSDIVDECPGDIPRNVRSELSRRLDLCCNRSKYANMSVRPSMGLVLSGPPGCGKMTATRSLARDSGVRFVRAFASQFDNKNPKLVTNQVTQLFDEARSGGPSVVFLQGLDGGKTKLSEALINQLTREIDICREDKNHRVVVVASVHDRHLLDQSLVRSGRLDKLVEMKLPNASDRLKILESLTSGMQTLCFKPEIVRLAALTVGCSPADLTYIASTAGVLAVQDKRSDPDGSDWDVAYDQVVGSQRKQDYDLAFRIAHLAYVQTVTCPGSLKEYSLAGVPGSTLPEGDPKDQRVLLYHRHAILRVFEKLLECSKLSTKDIKETVLTENV